MKSYIILIHRFFVTCKHFDELNYIDTSFSSSDLYTCWQVTYKKQETNLTWRLTVVTDISFHKFEKPPLALFKRDGWLTDLVEKYRDDIKIPIQINNNNLHTSWSDVSFEIKRQHFSCKVHTHVSAVVKLLFVFYCCWVFTFNFEPLFVLHVKGINILLIFRIKYFTNSL